MFLQIYVYIVYVCMFIAPEMLKHQNLFPYFFIILINNAVNKDVKS